MAIAERDEHHGHSGLQVVNALARSELANITNLLGDKLAALLPDRVGLDVFKGNYSQSYIPGLVTALTGLRYDPCLLSIGGVGGLLGAALPI